MGVGEIQETIAGYIQGHIPGPSSHARRLDPSVGIALKVQLKKYYMARHLSRIVIEAIAAADYNSSRDVSLLPQTTITRSYKDMYLVLRPLFDDLTPRLALQYKVKQIIWHGISTEM